MHHHHFSCRAQVGMRVSSGGFAVGGPTCMTYANSSNNRLILHQQFEIRQFACVAPDFYMSIGDHCKSRRIISAVLKFF